MKRGKQEGCYKRDTYKVGTDEWGATSFVFFMGQITTISLDI